MNKFITINDINPLKRAFKSFQISTIQRYKSWKAMKSIINNQLLFNQIEQSKHYSDKLSYSYRLFDFKKKDNLFHFNVYTDNEIGGSSKGKLYYDCQNQCLTIEGTINDKDKDKLTNFPSIGIARIHNHQISCGPFNAISIEIDGDGLPFHFGVQILSQVHGIVPCYGIIASKLKGWRRYELPFSNMIIVGNQENMLNGINSMALNTTIHGTMIGADNIDMRRIMSSQFGLMQLQDINIRLLGSKTVGRKISIKSIDLVRRSHSKQFINDYLHPYFYLVDNEAYKVDKQIGISWLNKGYESFNNIEIGDKTYTRAKGKYNNKT